MFLGLIPLLFTNFRIKYSVDDFSIKLPEKSPLASPDHRQHKPQASPKGRLTREPPKLSPPDAKKARLLESLDLALIKPEDVDLPRRRRQSLSKAEARKNYQAARDRRKLMFSSDEEEEEKEFSPAPVMDFNVSQTPDYEEETKPPVKKEPESPKPAEPVKRRRGRPRKGEQEKKLMTVTRRSKRIVENPDLRKHHTPEPAILLVPKPLRALGLGLLTFSESKPEPTATLITKSALGRQKPLTVDAERIHTANSRDKRFTLTTLDVLRQLVDEANPKAVKNEIINESAVLYEFKAHLLYSISHLMDVHASTKDISHDVMEVQRQKTEMRRNILELKKEHANVGEQLNKLRNEHNLHKEKQAQFNNTVDAIAALKEATANPASYDDHSSLSDTVLMKLADVTRVFHPQLGLQQQLQIINEELSRKLENRT